MTKPDIPKLLYFRSDRPFYSIVIAFFSSIVGLQALIDESNHLRIKPNQRLPIGGQVHDQFSINVYELFELHRGERIDSSQLTAALCCMLANTAYELVKTKNDKSPIFELFRHIRNASSHENKFRFRNGQPQHRSNWRGKSIDHLQQGDSNPLQGTVCFFDYLGPADLVLLLWDVEQRLYEGAS